MKIRPVHIEPPAISPAPSPGLSLLLDGEKMRDKLIIGGVCVLRTSPSTRPRKCAAPAGFLCLRCKLASLGLVRRQWRGDALRKPGFPALVFDTYAVDCAVKPGNDTGRVWPNPCYFPSASARTTCKRAELSNWFTVGSPVFGSSM